MFGIAKKIDNELNDLPLHTHQAIVQMISVGAQHRQVAMQRKEHEEQMERQKQALEQNEARLKLEQLANERAAAAQAHAALKPQPELVKQ